MDMRACLPGFSTRRGPGRVFRTTATVALLALLLSVLVFPAKPAEARPPFDDTWGANDKVWDIERVGDRIYLGGEFTQLVDGGSSVVRNHIAAIDALTGLPIDTWTPSANDDVIALDSSPDGSIIYAGGRFTDVSGHARRKIVALDAITGDVIPGWDPVVQTTVRGIDADANTVWFGGDFTTVDGSTRNRLASVDAATGVLTSWNPSVNQRVQDLMLHPDQGSIYVAGTFTAINGSGRDHVARLDPYTNTLRSFNPNFGEDVFEIFVVDKVYAAVGGPGGKAMAFNLTSGSTVWSRQSDGDVQTVGYNPPYVYYGGHFDAIFGSAKERLVRMTTGGTIDHSWDPKINLTPLGAWAMHGSNNYMYIGGEFSHVNDQRQDNFVQFQVSAAPEISIDKPADGNTVSGFAPILLEATDQDEDPEDLTVEVSIDGGPLLAATWNGGLQRHEYLWDTSAVTPGVHTIDAKVTDGSMVETNALQISVLVQNGRGSYVGLVMSQGPAAYWRLGETSGSPAEDRSGNNRDGTYVNGVALNQPSLIFDLNDPDPAAGFDGNNDYMQVPNSSGINTLGPYDEKTIDLWFNADEVSSRQVLYEQGGSTRGLNIYIDSGSVYVGGWNNPSQGPTTPWGPVHVGTPVTASTLNHVALVLDANAGTIEGYLNGVSFGTVAAGNLHSDSSAAAVARKRSGTTYHTGYSSGSGDYFNGVVDEVAHFNTALTAQMVLDHYEVGIGDMIPDVTIDLPLDGVTIVGMTTIVVDATDLEDDIEFGAGSLNVEVSTNGGASWVNAPWNGTSSRYEYDWDSTLSAEGFTPIMSRAGDTGFNTGTALVEPTVWVNNINEVPAATVVSPDGLTIIAGLELVMIDATDPEDDHLLGPGTLSVDMNIDGGSWQPTTWNPVSGYYELVWDSVPTGDGSRTVNARVTDSAVQTGIGIPAVVTVDNSNPEAYADEVLLSGPIAYWRLGEASGTTAADSSGNARDGTYSGPTLGVPGVVSRTFDTAADFDGVNDRVEVADYTDIQIGGPWSEKTVELWFDADGISNRQVLYEQGGITRGLNVYIVGGQLYAGAWNTGMNGVGTPWGPVFVSSPITADEQHYAALVIEQATGLAKLYLDGVEVDSQPGIGPLFSHSSNVGIGRMDEHTYFHDGTQLGDGNYFDGTLDDIALYNSALMPLTILDHFGLGEENRDPVASIVAPVDGSTIAGTHTIQVDATDNEDLAGTLTVEISIDAGPQLPTVWNGGLMLYELAGWDTTLLTEDIHSVTATVTDSGSAQVMATVNVRTENVDNDPVVSITNPVDSTLVSGPVTIQVDASDDRDAEGTLLVEVSIDGGTYATATSIGGTLYELSPPWDTSLEPDGPHTVDARATDVSVQTTNATQVNVTTDTAPPSSVVITSPAGASTLSGVYTVQVDAADAVEAVGALDVEVSIDGGAWVPAPWNSGTTRYETAWDTSLDTDGPHTIDARATDSALLTTNATQVPVTVDNTAPSSVLITNPVNATTVAGTITVQVDAADAVEPLGDLDVDVSIDGGAAVTASWNGTLLRYEYSWDTTALSDGIHTVDATATDNGLNVTAATQVSVTTENFNDPPSAVISDPLDAELVASIVLIDVTAFDDRDVAGSLSVQVRVDGGAWWPAAWTGSVYQVSWNTTAYADSTHTIDARATDVFPHTTNATQIIVSVDNSNPNAYADAVLADGPVAYLRLGEASGSTAADSSGNGNTGTYTSGPTLGVAGVVARTPDTAVDFDGVNDYVNIADSPDINNGGPFSEKSVELWFDADTVTPRQVLYEQGGDSRGISVYVEADMLYGLVWNVPSDGPGTPYGPLVVSTPVTAGEQHHVVLVIDDVGDVMELYLDGTSVDTVGGVGPLHLHSANIGLGAMNDTARFADGTEFGNGRYFDGTIDDLALYNSLLSAGRVLDHYLLGVTDRAPTASVVSPLDGGNVTGTVTVEVNAADGEDPPGSLTVEVSVDGGPWQPAVWNALSFLYEYVGWDTTSLPEGPVSVQARATDSGLAETLSAVVNPLVENVDDAPVVALTLPVDLSEVNGSVVVQVDASDDRDAEGSLTVEVSVDGGAFVAASSVGGTLYELVWDTTLESEGPHTVDARATDVFPNVVDAAQVSVSVENVNAVPVVAITSPADLDTRVGLVDVEVDVSDAETVDPFLLTVEVSIDGGSTFPGVAVWTPGISRFVFGWDTTLVVDGTYVLQARATDLPTATDPAETGLSSTISVEVDNLNAAPTVSITDPVAASTVLGTVVVSVDAADVEDDVDLGVGNLLVEVSIDGGAYQVATWNTVDAYEFSWDTTLGADGPHTVDARVTDAVFQTVDATQGAGPGGER